jgi:hypothetical protein
MAETPPPIETEEGNLTEQLIESRKKPKEKSSFEGFKKLQNMKLPKLGNNVQKAEGTQQGTAKAPQPKNWRHRLPSHINTEINELVNETHNHRDAYMKTLKARDAQLWVALAHVNKRLKELEKRLDNY